LAPLTGRVAGAVAPLVRDTRYWGGVVTGVFLSAVVLALSAGAYQTLALGCGFDGTAFWTGVGSLGVCAGVLVGGLTIIESQRIARIEASARLLEQAADTSLQDAYRIVAPRDVPIAKLRERAKSTYLDRDAPERDKYLRAVQDLSFFYERVRALCESGIVQKELIYEQEADGILTFYYVIEDATRSEESEEGYYEPDWRRFCADVQRFYCERPAQQTQAVLRDWKPKPVAAD
jgi:hypothetical protein